MSKTEISIVIFWACLFDEKSKSHAFTTQSFLPKKAKKDFKQAVQSFMQRLTIFHIINNWSIN